MLRGTSHEMVQQPDVGYRERLLDQAGDRAITLALGRRSTAAAIRAGRRASRRRAKGAAVGTGVKSLAPEYLQRARADGQASAEAWYVEQARDLASRQILSNRVESPLSGLRKKEPTVEMSEV